MKLIKFICIFLISITVCVFCMKTSRYENYEVPGTLVSKNIQKHNKHYYMSIQYIMHVKPNDTIKFKNYSVYVDYATYCTHNIGDKVTINGPLYVSSNAASPSGSVSNKVTTITRKVAGSAHPYNTTGDLGWMDESSITKYVEPTPTPAPTPRELAVGDTVKIIGTGNGSSYGGSNTAYGLGWTRQILGIYPGRPFPYRVGNSTGTTGFYPASSLQRL